ncbi:NAD(P)H-dependent flavin oxidoreductase [Legionella pneumophila]|uniref:Nitronate monooxygenase n=1 Tax=Legionella pneumophila subsp. pascullei TaxID=91890 RepID=A0AAX2IVY6_LEGPN|nr:nitronate monooxygenase [Legionella pneumophila]AMP90155.1 nitronate monooxygenase [Legionella pneumophila subsp. pascullei]AMP92176.1 nitronate monooxygenase [Legionella pneumophila subsp. pascullei]AMP95142.1 nitronate monooxygenase [Legionella pneumophila subsp. pascullei]SQG90023.1 2-nitropropane dioxygenase [Legionella pneumophila subsp. pascullei]VEH05880.1 2-nitropropane dioxygenase [Legionella pneumophila subsp. pascullei]
MRDPGLTEKLGFQFPIIQAPMAGGATTPELVAAVSNSGGLGSLGAGYMKPNEIKQVIRKIRQLTNKPFAVNLFIPEAHHATREQIQKACDDINLCCTELNIEISPVSRPYSQSFVDQMQILIEEKIPVFSYAFGILEPMWIKHLKKNGTFLIGTATTIHEAIILEESGIDAIVAQGSEAGGHRGTFIGNAEDALIQLSDLIPQIIDKIKIPVIAAGGIMDGKGIMSAMNAGASGVQMGTAFLSCFEAGISHQYKQSLLSQQQDNTVLTRAFSGKLARGIRNKFITCMDNRKINILDYPIQNALTQVMRQKAKENDNIDFMSLWAGQSAQLCRHMSAGDLINTLVIEAEMK